MNLTNISIQEVTIEDIPEMIALWKETANICFSDEVHYPETLSRYLKRNPGLSFVARDGRDSRIIGTLLAGTDGMYGTFRHVVVSEEYRGTGIIDELFHASYSGFASYEISEFFLYVLDCNEIGIKAFVKRGWSAVSGVDMFHKKI